MASIKFTIIQVNISSIASNLRLAATQMGKYAIGASGNLAPHQTSPYFARIFVGINMPRGNLQPHLPLWIMEKAARNIHVIMHAC